MNTKKVIASAGVALTMLLGASSVVIAQDVAPTVAPVKADHKMVVQIGPGGRTLLRGTVTAVGTNSLTVKSWGGDWIINVSDSTKLMPGSDMSQFNVGDFIGTNGVASQTALTIDATLVRNWTERKVIQDTKKEIRELIKATAAKNWQGIASNVNTDAKTLTLTVDGTVYNIVLAVGAKIVNVKFMEMDFSLVKNGDIVRVYGPAVDTTITASVLRDVSVK